MAFVHSLQQLPYNFPMMQMGHQGKVALDLLQAEIFPVASQLRVLRMALILPVHKVYKDVH